VPTAIDFFTDHAVYRFTTEYWDANFTHVDLGDANLGIIASGPGVGSLEGVPETWYVRNSLNTGVPEPGSVALMALGAGVLLLRRRLASRG